VPITASVPNDEARDSRRFERIERTVRENQASIADTVRPIVTELGKTIEDKLAAGFYTREQADAAMAARVAAPGAIAPTSVTATGAVSVGTSLTVTGAGSVGGTLQVGGRLTANVGMTSTGVRANQVVFDYVAMYVDRDGNFGYAPSTMATKSLLRNFTADLDHWLTLIPKVFFYKDDPTQTEQLGLYAELVVRREPMLGIYDEQHRLRGIRYELLGVVALALIQAHVAETRAFRDDVLDRLESLEAPA